MAEGANTPVKLPHEAVAAAPIEARKAVIQATRDRMANSLDVLEHRARAAVGIRDHVVAASPGQRRAVTAATALFTARRLWRLPFWRLTAISVATAGFVAFGAWRHRTSTSRSVTFPPTS